MVWTNTPVGVFFLAMSIFLWLDRYMKQGMGAQMKWLAKLGDWIDSQPKWLVVVLGALLWVAIYGLPNRFQFHGPYELPLILGEENIPFVPMATWVYVSAFLQLIVATVILPKGRFGKAVAALAVIATIHSFFFIVFPTWFPRTHETTNWLYNLLRSVEEPTNCLPSLHTSFVLLSSWALWRMSSRKGFWFFIWAVLIIISTLLTKQHYIVDIIAGAAVALIVHRKYYGEWPFKTSVQ